MTDWTRFTVRLEAMRRLAQAKTPAWGEPLDRALERIGRLVAAGVDRATVLSNVDQEVRLCWSDPDLRRGSWREEQLLTIKVHLLTPSELEELDRLAREVADSMAAALV